MAVTEHRGRVMASELLVVAIGDGDDEIPLSAPVELLEHLERCWSRFIPDSDISRLNLTPGRPIAVDPSTVTLLATMLEGWEVTDRRFDPTVLRALVAAGYGASIDDPMRVTILPSGQLDWSDDTDEPTLAALVIDAIGSMATLPTGLTIDAGGIGKGLAGDLAGAQLLAGGATGALVSIGGDLSMAGTPPVGGWLIEIEHPDRDRGIVCTIAVNGGGVATSSTRSRRWHNDGVERHHVIDPWTGQPSTTDLAAVTVVARSGWLAEAHATAALLAGSHHVIDHLERHDLSGLAVTDDGELLATDDLAVGMAPPAGSRIQS